MQKEMHEITDRTTEIGEYERCVSCVDSWQRESSHARRFLPALNTSLSGAFPSRPLQGICPAGGSVFSFRKKYLDP
jgi:hypothetical protein